MNLQGAPMPSKIAWTISIRPMSMVIMGESEVCVNVQTDNEVNKCSYEYALGWSSDSIGRCDVSCHCHLQMSIVI